MAGDRASTTRTTRVKVDPDAIAAVPCPIDRARRVSILARNKGTLSGPAGRRVAEIRQAAMREARAAGTTVLDLAHECGITTQRVYSILRGVGRA